LGGNNTDQLNRDLADLNLEGVDALLSVSPYYNKPSQAVIIYLQPLIKWGHQGYPGSLEFMTHLQQKLWYSDAADQ